MKNILFILGLSFFSFLFLHLLSTHMLQPIDGNWYSGGSTWGDLAVHLSLITNFSEKGLSILSDNPVYSGTRLNYPFLPDLLSALLNMAGLSLRYSLIIPSFVGIVSVVGLMYVLSYRITKSKIGSFFVPLLFFFNGSIVGLYYFWKDKEEAGVGLVKFLSQMQFEYAHLADYNLRFSNIIADYILPQRAIIFGLLLGIFSIYFLWDYWDKKKEKSLIKAAFTISFVPLIHAHTFLALGMASGFLFLIDLFSNRKLARTFLGKWLMFFGIVILIGIPQILLINPAENSGFIRFYLGWMREKDESLGFFWLNNLTPHIFLFLAGFLVAEKKLKTFYLAFFTVFAVTNIVIFQPHNYDNMKIMLYTFLLSCVLVAALIDYFLKIFSKKAFFIIIPFMLAATIVGILSVYRESYVSWQMFSKEDIVMAEFVKKNTDKNSLFLTSDQHNNPIPTLSGRKILMGYRGWLWTYGIDYRNREEDILSMYSGGASSIDLLKEYNVNYVLIENGKVGVLGINEIFFSENFKLFYQSPNYKIYKIN